MNSAASQSESRTLAPSSGRYQQIPSSATAPQICFWEDGGEDSLMFGAGLESIRDEIVLLNVHPMKNT